MDHVGSRRTVTLTLLTLAAVSHAACVGSVEGGPGRAGGDDEEPSDPRSKPTPGDPGKPGLDPGVKDPQGFVEVAGPRALLRLTATEYRNTIRDLFGAEAVVPDLAKDPVGQHGFADAPLIEKASLEELFDAAGAVAAQVVANPAPIASCMASAGGDAACAREIITRVGRRAYRRPLSAAETEGLAALYDKSRDELKLGHDDGVRVLLTAMLMSPSFLYHWEAGSSRAVVENAAVRLNPHEIASRLSYTLWASMPDEALFAAADRGELATEAQVAVQVDRMLKDPRFERAIDEVHRYWLHLDVLAGVAKDPKLFPGFNAELKAAMTEEIRRFTRSIYASGDASLTALLTARKTFANAALASLYGLSGITGNEMREVSLEGKTRSGLLTLPGFIAAHTNASTSNPARMGALLFDGFMCMSMEPPPPEAVNSFEFDDALTTRANFERTESMQTCAGCHRLINPLGYAFESFDAIGQDRRDEDGRPIDPSGVYRGTKGEERFSDVVGLGAILARSAEVQSCVAQRWMRYALGRVEGDQDAGNVARLARSLQDSGLNLKALVKSIATSRTFRYRALEAGETP